MRSRNRVFVFAGALALMLAGASIHASSPVADAAMKGDADMVRTLVRQGADVNAAQPDGMTALHWAALNGDLKVMDVLLVAGAATESLTRLGGYTPLHLASSKGHAPIVARLLEAGSKPKALTATGVQPIHLAAQAGSADAVRLLIDRGADANARDNTHGRTPLVFAASQNRIEAMRMLIEKGANSRLETTVIDYPQRQTADNQSRVARDRLITAATGKAPVAPPQFNPPQTGRAATVGQDPAAGAAAPCCRRRGADRGLHRALHPQDHSAGCAAGHPGRHLAELHLDAPGRADLGRGLDRAAGARHHPGRLPDQPEASGRHPGRPGGPAGRDGDRLDRRLHVRAGRGRVGPRRRTGRAQSRTWGC